MEDGCHPPIRGLFSWFLIFFSDIKMHLLIRNYDVYAVVNFYSLCVFESIQGNCVVLRIKQILHDLKST